MKEKHTIKTVSIIRVARLILNKIDFKKRILPDLKKTSHNDKRVKLQNAQSKCTKQKNAQSKTEERNRQAYFYCGDGSSPLSIARVWIMLN